MLKKKLHIKISQFDSISSTHWLSSLTIKKAAMNQYLFEDLGDFAGMLPGVMMFDLGSAGQALCFRRFGSSPIRSAIYFDGRLFFDPLTSTSDLNCLPAGFIDQLFF